MRVYYSQKKDKTGPGKYLAHFYLAVFRTAIPFVLVIYIFPLVMRSRMEHPGILFAMGMFLMSAVLLVVLKKRLSGRLMLVSDGTGRLCLMPDGGVLRKELRNVRNKEADILRENVIPTGAMDIQHTLTLWHLGRFCLVRCLVRGRATTKYLLINDSFKNYEELIREFEVRME